MADQAEDSEIKAPCGEHTLKSVEATIVSTAQGGVESNSNFAESSVTPVDREKTLEFAEELMTRGSKAAKEQDHDEATDCFSRALEIRVAHFGELAPECVNDYYKYGCALLYKAQDEADPLGSMPKKEAGSDKDGSGKGTAAAESSSAVVSSDSGSSTNRGKEKAPDAGAEEGNDQEEEVESDAEEDTAEGDEDESDLDLAWKMLDVARAIAEKHLPNTIEMVDILSALAEVSLEREDVETSLADYLKALSILEQIVEPDSRHLAELNFRISLCLEIGTKAEEATPYCEKAISICKSRVLRLSEEAKGLSNSTLSEAGPPESVQTLTDIEAEIKMLSGLSVDLEKKLEDLQLLVLNPVKSFLSEILGAMTAKASGSENADLPPAIGMGSSQLATSNSNLGFDTSTVSTGHTNGGGGAGAVTDLGVVGRGVKRVQLNSISSESNPAKRPATDPSPNNDDSNAS